MRLFLQYFAHMSHVLPAVVPPKKDADEKRAAPTEAGNSGGAQASGLRAEDRVPTQAPPPKQNAMEDGSQVAVGQNPEEEVGDTSLDAELEADGFTPSKKAKLAAAKTAAKAAKAKAGASRG